MLVVVFLSSLISDCHSSEKIRVYIKRNDYEIHLKENEVIKEHQKQLREEKQKNNNLSKALEEIELKSSDLKETHKLDKELIDIQKQEIQGMQKTIIAQNKALAESNIHRKVFSTI